MVEVLAEVDLEEDILAIGKIEKAKSHSIKLCFY
jgi:hypothetical protein